MIRKFILNFKLTALAVFIVAGFLVFVFEGGVQAQVNQPSTELYGWAWSEDIGWISFNSCDGAGNCGPAPYSVSVNNRNGQITGYAWSENSGWLKFGGLSGFPVGQGTVKDNAKMNLSEGTPAYGKWHGWARFCFGTLLGDCSSMDNSPDGDDGWVSLSGDLHPAPDQSGNGGVSYDEESGKIVGWAWGGDAVGWIDFWDVSFGPPQPFDYLLSNLTSQLNPVQIIQDGNASVVIEKTLVSGQSQPVSIIIDELPPNITVSIDTNNPCGPTCSSQITIYDDGAALGLDSFEISGDVLINGQPRKTTVWFEIVESEPQIEVSCEAIGGPFLIPGSSTVTWQATVENPEGGETFEWEGDDDLTCDGQPSVECQTVEKTYSTVGQKQAMVSIDGGESFAECQAAIGVIMQFQEF